MTDFVADAGIGTTGIAFSGAGTGVRGISGRNESAISTTGAAIAGAAGTCRIGGVSGGVPNRRGEVLLVCSGREGFTGSLIKGASRVKCGASVVPDGSPAASVKANSMNNPKA
jgi:hypothetical protein